MPTSWQAKSMWRPWSEWESQNSAPTDKNLRQSRPPLRAPFVGAPVRTWLHEGGPRAVRAAFLSPSLAELADAQAIHSGDYFRFASTPPRENRGMGATTVVCRCGRRMNFLPKAAAILAGFCGRAEPPERKSNMPDSDRSTRRDACFRRRTNRPCSHQN